jgi:hypothetical protein
VKRTAILILLVGLLFAQPAVSDWVEPHPEFVFARLSCTNRGNWWKYWIDYWPDNPPWHHDYPHADEYLTSLLHELSGVRVKSGSYEIVKLESSDIFKYPFLYLSEPGFLELNDKEIKNLGEYIRRGGFIMADDFRGKGFLLDGPEELDVLRHYMKLAVPEREFVRLDITHPIFHSFFDIDTLAMKAPYPLPKPPEFWGMLDENGNVQVIANYNNDVGDFWKYLDHGDKPLADSSRAVRLGMDYVIYAMTH